MKQTQLQFKWVARKKLPIILQDEMMECGHACIAMISHFWGRRINLLNLRQLYQPSSHGITLRTISDICVALGFKTRAIKIPLESLRLLKKPAILHWNMNHFVVLKQIKKNQAIIHDPAIGIRYCSLTELSQSFTGIALEVETAATFTPSNTPGKFNLFALMQATSGLYRTLAILLIFALCFEVCTLLHPLFLQYVTDHLTPNGDDCQMYSFIFGFLILILIQAYIEYNRHQLALYLSKKLTEGFASNTMQHLLKLPLHFFHSRSQGDLQAKFQSIEQIQKKLSHDFINILLDGCLFILHLSIMFYYSRLLTSIVLVTLLLYSSLRYFSYQGLKKYTVNSIVHHAQVSSFFLETLRAITPIKTFAQENLRFNLWRNRYIDALNADIRIDQYEIFYQIMHQLLFNLEHLFIIGIGAKLVFTQQFSVGMLIAFLAYRLLLINKASSFLHQLFDYRLINIQLQRLSDILLQSPEKIDPKMAYDGTIQSCLMLDHLSFQYHAMAPTLFSNINLSIEAGEKIVITGPSGCGKSTLLKIMMGLLSPTTGQVMIDHRSLSDFGVGNYRKMIASVMQDDMLLSGSILSNITFFAEEVDLAWVYQVAKLVCIDADIQRLPMGYETLLGELGTTLSGGQKQRLLLARALYKKPLILFLDEATSHLDIEHERQINHALKSLDMTQIMIAHRPETIQMADRVYQLGK